MNKLTVLFKFPIPEKLEYEPDAGIANRMLRNLWREYHGKYAALVFSRWVTVILIIIICALVIT